jgi:uncharacterized membrane-anchored protein YhcB (DUF1043 family)
MIQYLRIPKNKFWGWVASSLAVGLVLGVGVTYVVSRAGSSKQIDDLKQQLASQSSQAASNSAELQSRLDSADTSLTALSQQYSQLQAQTAAANASSAKKSSSSSDSSATATLEVLSRTVSPSTISTGDDITLTAKVQGKPDKVTMRVRNSTTGFDETYTLKKISTSSTSQTWRSTVAGPKKAGKYTYYATAYRSGKSATMPGASTSSFTVTK